MSASEDTTQVEKKEACSHIGKLNCVLPLRKGGNVHNGHPLVFFRKRNMSYYPHSADFL